MCTLINAPESLAKGCPCDLVLILPPWFSTWLQDHPEAVQKEMKDAPADLEDD